jgi:hypothetical protein
VEKNDSSRTPHKTLVPYKRKIHFPPANLRTLPTIKQSSNNNSACETPIQQSSSLITNNLGSAENIRAKLDQNNITANSLLKTMPAGMLTDPISAENVFIMDDK